MEQNTFDIVAPPVPKKRRMILKTFFVIIGLAVLGYFLPNILGLFFRDSGPIDDSDLRLQKTMIPDSENGYFDLMKIKDTIYNQPADTSQSLTDILDGKTWDQAFVDDLLQNNEEALGYFSVAAEKQYIQNPAVSDPTTISPGTVLPLLGTYRTITNISTAKALSLAKQGREKEALDEALKSIVVAQKIQNSQISLIEYLVTLVMKARGLKTIQIIISKGNLDSNILREYTKKLGQYTDNEVGLISGFKAEYHSLAWVIDTMTDKIKEGSGAFQKEFGDEYGNVRSSYHFHPNETKTLFAGYARSNIRDTQMYCGNIQPVEIKAAIPQSVYKSPSIISAIRLYVTENMSGKLLHDIVAASLQGAQLKRCQTDFLETATLTQIAIKAFLNDKKIYPASLDELVPEYLASIPIDSFDGKQLKYDPNEKVIYSGGEEIRKNKKDNWKNIPELKLQLGF